MMTGQRYEIELNGREYVARIGVDGRIERIEVFFGNRQLRAIWRRGRKLGAIARHVIREIGIEHLLPAQAVVASGWASIEEENEMIDPNDIAVLDPRDIDADLGNPEIAECERTLLRDIARIRGTRAAALAAVEEFIIGWLKANPDHDGDYPDPPENFLDAYRAWWGRAQAEPWFTGYQPHQLDDPLAVLFWDLVVWVSPMMRKPPPADLPEAVMIDALACDREIQWAVSPIWKRRYPEADRAQWVEWYRMTSEFYHPSEA
jgi:hypothetical protein